MFIKHLDDATKSNTLKAGLQSKVLSTTNARHLEGNTNLSLLRKGSVLRALAHQLPNKIGLNHLKVSQSPRDFSLHV